YVGNAKQAAHFYKTAFGFQSLAYCGPETGTREKASYAIRQNNLTLVLTTPIRPNNPIADHIYEHGDGVKALALTVEDATSAWEETTKRGGKSFMEPKTLSDEHGELVMSGIHTYGDVVHLFRSEEHTSELQSPYGLVCRLLLDETSRRESYTLSLHDALPIYIYEHGDGVKALALTVEDATSAWEETTKRGGKSFMEPKTLSDEHGELVMSGIHTYGDVVHLF